ncbi:RIP metalloprotease RseP [Candidatus Uhrbacteria bacterium]|nr:RIP metalloprotease RseP [Candidatus Uhrbacteria bacterium]
MGTLLLFIIVLSLLVFVHEFGHFIVAKRMGMKVDEFGFGFPPRLWGVKREETTYSINWIPLGGFVKIKGESGEYAHEMDSFASKKAWQRFLVLVAGVGMNLVLAAVLFSIGYLSGLPSVIDETLPSSARVADEAITVMQVVEGSPAAEAGIVEGDEIVSVDGQVFDSDAGAREYLLAHSASGVAMVVHRSNALDRTYNLASAYLPSVDTTGVGIAFVSTGLVSYPFFQAVGQGVWTTIQLTAEVVKAFYGLIRDLIVTQHVGVDLSGPVGIAVMTGQVAAMGLIYLLQFTAILSINLAIINIFPFPALDGGRVLFLLIEKFRGRPVNQRIEIAAHNLGFMLLMALVVLVTYKDLVTFSDEIVGAIKNVISI